MKIKIQFFGYIQDKVNCKSQFIDIENNADLGKAVKSIRNLFPNLDMNNSIRIAVNTEYADLRRELVDGDTISFIPPVGGG